jgi:hypothetical protein
MDHPTVTPMTNKSSITKDWFVSSATVPANNCVEARIHQDGSVDVRNSKSPSGPWVSYTKGEWIAFLVGAKDGEFDVA